MSDAPFRILPRITDRNEPFWASGKDGVLRFQRCQSCGYWIHPHSVLCPECLSKDIAYEAVSGRATVHTMRMSSWVLRSGARSESIWLSHAACASCSAGNTSWIGRS